MLQMLRAVKSSLPALFAALAITAIAASAAPAPPPPPKRTKWQQAEAERFKNSAPADEYFGRMKMSFLGMNNTFRDSAISSGDHTTDQGIVNKVALAEDALNDWARRYPRDPQLARTYFLAVQVERKIWIKPNQDRAWIYLNRLVQIFPDSYFGKTLKRDIAIGFTEHYYAPPEPCATPLPPTDLQSPDASAAAPSPTPSPMPTVTPTPDRSRRRSRRDCTRKYCRQRACRRRARRRRRHQVHRRQRRRRSLPARHPYRTKRRRNHAHELKLSREPTTSRERNFHRAHATAIHAAFHTSCRFWSYRMYSTRRVNGVGGNGTRVRRNRQRRLGNDGNNVDAVRQNR